MSTHEQITNNPTSAVRNTGGRNGPQGLEEPMSDEILREMCDKNYHQLLPLIAEKMQKEKEQKDKLNAVKALAKPRITQSFSPETAMSFPPLREEEGTEGPMIIEVEMVYRSNEASHAKDGGKLGPKWEGPYEVKESLGKGAYKLKDHKGNDMPRTWNICDSMIL
ncbi:hypothetical protein Tco_1496645, partial [Tanacetum coccineum]